MPYTLNGIGTHYWGKSNLEVRRDNCGHCQAVGDLKSYDTTKYFVFLFLPLIPLGKLRILDQCPACSRHRAIRLREWQQLRRESVRQAIEAWESTPADADAARQAVQACVTFQDRERFVQLAGKILQHHGDDAAMVAYVGSTLNFFDHLPQAEAAYRKSLSLADDAAIREALGVVLVRQDRPDEARPLLEHLSASSDPGAAGPLFLLVEGYQAQGRHTDALQILDTLEQRFPQLAKEKGFRKYRKVSRKHQRSGKRVASAALAPASAATESAFSRRFATLVWPVLLLAIVGPLSCFGYRSASSHRVFLVNGLPERYAVTLGDDKHHLPPGRAVKVEVKQGPEHVVRVAGDGPDLEPVTFRVDLPFWQSWRGEHTFVVNPDRLAVLLWEQAEYAENPDPDLELPYEVHAGEAFYTFEGVDYEFRDFPEEITLRSSSSRARRQKLDVVADQDPTQVFFVLSANGDEKALDYLKRAVSLLPENETAVFQLAGTAPIEDFAALAAPRLAARPVEVEWHRAYQFAMGRHGRGRELAGEYAGLLSAEPDDAGLHYLAARIELDASRAEELLRRAIELDPAHAWAHSSLAFRRLANGRFADALPPARRAVELEPENATFAANERNARLANRQYGPLLEDNLSGQEQQPLDGELVALEILLRSANGETEAAAACVGAYLERLQSAEEGQALGDPEQWRHYLEALAGHGRGDLAAYGEHIGQVEGAWSAFQSALARGAMQEAHEALSALESSDADNHLLVYLGARRAGDDELAAQHLEAAIERLAQGDQEQRLIAAALAGEAVDADLLELSVDAPSKAIALAALAVRDPARRQAYRSLARKLNFHLGFPRLYLEEILSGSA